MRYHDHGSSAEEIPDAEDRSNWLPMGPLQRTRHPFTYAHYPNGWTHDTDGWSPRLVRVAHYPGVNGVRRLADGSSDARPALLVCEASGALVLHRARFKVDGQDYVVRHRCQDGGWHYTNRFASFVTIGGKMRAKVDAAGFRAWRLGLIGAGFIEAMPVEVLEDQLALVSKRIARLERDPRIGSAYVQRGLEEAQAKAAAMRLDYDKQFNTEAEEAA